MLWLLHENHSLLVVAALLIVVLLCMLVPEVVRVWTGVMTNCKACRQALTTGKKIDTLLIRLLIRHFAPDTGKAV